jgi:biopolymer transport protein ExbB/TolQ
MLSAGVDNLGESSELIEEVMYETVLTTRLRVNRMLPFIAVCAASAPLLGLLGTVTGIIDTFKMITVFGSGDVRNLSGGISEALVTTEWGLIVAIPALLLHSFLSRKARAVIGHMEQVAVAFTNAATKAALRPRPGVSGSIADRSATELPDPDLVRAQVHAILQEMLGPLARELEDVELAPVHKG